MVDAVYSALGDVTPFGRIEDAAEMGRGMGSIATVRPGVGYFPSAESWLPETRFPTRLGADGQLVALCDAEGRPIRRTFLGSLITLPSHRLKDLVHQSQDGPFVRISTLGTYDHQKGLIYKGDAP